MNDCFGVVNSKQCKLWPILSAIDPNYILSKQSASINVVKPLEGNTYNEKCILLYGELCLDSSDDSCQNDCINDVQLKTAFKTGIAVTYM